MGSPWFSPASQRSSPTSSYRSPSTRYRRLQPSFLGSLRLERSSAAPAALPDPEPGPSHTVVLAYCSPAGWRPRRGVARRPSVRRSDVVGLCAELRRGRRRMFIACWWMTVRSKCEQRRVESRLLVGWAAPAWPRRAPVGWLVGWMAPDAGGAFDVDAAKEPR